jgi:uncharacterized protein (TIGR02265 family)
MNKTKPKLIEGDSSQEVVRGSAANNQALQLSLKERFNYDYRNPPVTLPYDTYLAIIEHLRNALYPHKSREEGYEAIGEAAVEGHFMGTVGKVNKIAARMMGPVRSADLFIRARDKALLFGEHKMEEIHNGYLRYHVKGVPEIPAFVRGILRAALASTGVKNIAVKSQIISPEEVIYEATWE